MSAPTLAPTAAPEAPLPAPAFDPDECTTAFGWRLLDLVLAAKAKVGIGRGSGRATPYVLLVPSLAITAVLVGGLLYTIWISLHSFDSFLQEEGPLSLDQFRRLFSDDNQSYRSILLRTLWMSLLVTGSAVLLAAPTAYTIVRMRRPGLRGLAVLLLLVPFLMGESVRAFSWLVLLGVGGAVPWALGLLGFDVDSLLGGTFALWVGLLQVMVPLATLVLIPAFTKVDPDLERAAATLGARPSAVWRRVLFPLVRPGLAVAAVVVFALTMTEYAIPGVLGKGSTPFVANSVQGIYFNQGNLYFGAAYSVVLIGLVVLCGLVIMVALRGRSAKALR
jgi:putative spermidine/putrescine transport system permease protein